MGVHTDEDVQGRRGPHLPIMNLHERALSVLACKYVDEVIIGSPVVITDDLIKTFNISVVVRGTVTETGGQGAQGGSGGGAAQEGPAAGGSGVPSRPPSRASLHSNNGSPSHTAGGHSEEVRRCWCGVV